MKSRLSAKAKTANLEFPGRGAQIVMDSPLYPVHRFAPLVARIAALLERGTNRGASRPGQFSTARLGRLSHVNFFRISTLKSRRNPPIQSCWETVSGYRKQSGGITGGRLY